MRVAILTFDGFNELDSFIAFGLFVAAVVLTQWARKHYGKKKAAKT